MSWHFSRALVEACSAHTYSDSGLYAQSSTTPMPAAYYWPDKTTEHSRLSLFGMMSEPLTANLGAAWLMWFLAASLARTSVWPEKVQDSKEIEAAYGATWQGSLARYDRASCTWKIARCLPGADWTAFSGTWPKWGSMRSGVSYQRKMPALPINASGYGLLPTPRAQDGKHATATDYELTRERGKDLLHVRLAREPWRGLDPARGPLNPEFAEWLMGWPIGWTDLKPLETAKFQEWLQRHSRYYQPAANDSEMLRQGSLLL